MKQSAFLLLFLAFAFCAFAGSKVIVNPSYEVKNSGIFNVSKIELSDTSTRLSIQMKFVPGWWILLNQKDIFIKDSNTGKSFSTVGIEGAEFDKKLWMPKSGDSTIVLVFPSLDNTIKKLDFITYSESSSGESIFGISLDEKQTGQKKSSEVPKEVTKWLNAELAKSTRKNPIDFNSDQFFNEGNARLVGYLKGYDVRLGFTTGIIYASNDLTRDDFPIVVQIHPDGRFEADVPMISPEYTYVSIKNSLIPFYLEPGQTLSMILDWDEFLTADRLRNIRYQFKNIVFQGPLAKVNNDLAGFETKNFDYKKHQKKMETLAPEDFKADLNQQKEEDTKQLEKYIGDNKLTNQSKVILRNKLALDHAGKLFDYVMNRRYQATKDTANQTLKIPVPETYYDFLKNIDLNDQSLLIPSEFKSFVNRFEYCEPLSKSQAKNSFYNFKPEKDFLVFLMEEGVGVTEEEKELYTLIYKKRKTTEERTALMNKKDQVQALNEKYKEKLQFYSKKYVDPVVKTQIGNRDKENWRLKDSVLTSVLGLKPSLIYDITKIRSLRFTFKQLPNDAGSGFWENLKQGITNPYLIKTGDRLLAEAFPAEKAPAYTLPDGRATEIFKKIIDPFKGKILFVDFWATTCAPCVAGIKKMKPTRAKYYGNKDFDFIFITDERSSPEVAYKKLVDEQGMENIFRLSLDDYNYLRQLFKFNGIPRYVVIDKEGKVLNDNFPMHNFEFELSQMLTVR